eukprot:Platyproteum_vivax@DN5670_c0_g1_i3.p1
MPSSYLEAILGLIDIWEENVLFAVTDVQSLRRLFTMEASSAIRLIPDDLHTHEDAQEALQSGEIPPNFNFEKEHYLLVKMRQLAASRRLASKYAAVNRQLDPSFLRSNTNSITKQQAETAFNQLLTLERCTQKEIAVCQSVRSAICQYAFQTIEELKVLESLTASPKMAAQPKISSPAQEVLQDTTDTLIE